MSAEVNSPVELDPEIRSLLENIAVNEGIHSYSFHETGSSEKGDGYTSVITSIVISGKDASNKHKATHVAVKSLKQNDALKTTTDLTDLFQQEVYLYDTVLATFTRMEMEKGLPLSEFAPKFYKAVATNKNRALVLENLKMSGHRLYERRIPMDENHVELVMQHYGRLHAMSFAIRDQKPETFEKLLWSIDDVFMKKMITTDIQHMFIQKCIKAQDTLCSATDGKAIQVYGVFVKTVKQFFCNIIEATDKYSVVLHGDCWTNNMMFKYEDKSNETKPTKVSLVDFQCSRLGSPVLDLSVFFYCCSSNQIINNFNYYLQVYYEAFSIHLRKLGSDPEQLYPYSILQQHWKEYAKFGLIFSTLAIHVMLSESNETVDLSDVAKAGEGIKNAYEYQIANAATYDMRVRHIILHFVENNLI